VAAIFDGPPIRWLHVCRRVLALSFTTMTLEYIIVFITVVFTLSCVGLTILYYTVKSRLEAFRLLTVQMSNLKFWLPVRFVWMNRRALKNYENVERVQLSTTVSEIEVSVTQNDVSFEGLFGRVRPQLREHIDQALCQHRYDWLIKLSHLNRHKIGHFGDDRPPHPISWLRK